MNPVNPHYTDPEYKNHPVVYVLWSEAEKYCTSVGGRLPTEAEWEKAARGPTGSEYPWGNDLQSLSNLNVENKVGDTIEVGSFPQNQSAYGVLDMGSNAREWVQDWFESGAYAFSARNNPTGPTSGTYKVLKGAGFDDPATFTRAAHRLKHVPNSPGNNRGFRCVVSSISQASSSPLHKFQLSMHTRLEKVYLLAEPLTDLDKFMRLFRYFISKPFSG